MEINCDLRPELTMHRAILTLDPPSSTTEQRTKSQRMSNSSFVKHEDINKTDSSVTDDLENAPDAEEQSNTVNHHENTEVSVLHHPKGAKYPY